MHKLALTLPGLVIITFAALSSAAAEPRQLSDATSTRVVTSGSPVASSAQIPTSTRENVAVAQVRKATKAQRKAEQTARRERIEQSYRPATAYRSTGRFWPPVF